MQEAMHGAYKTFRSGGLAYLGGPERTVAGGQLLRVLSPREASLQSSPFLRIKIRGATSEMGSPPRSLTGKRWVRVPADDLRALHFRPLRPSKVVEGLRQSSTSQI